MNDKDILDLIKERLKIKIKVERPSYSSDKAIHIGLFLDNELISEDIVYKHELE